MTTVAKSSSARAEGCTAKYYSKTFPWEESIYFQSKMGTYINFSFCSYLEMWRLEVPCTDAKRWKGSFKPCMFYALRSEYFRGLLVSTQVSDLKKQPSYPTVCHK